MRCICLIDDDFKALKKAIPSIKKDVEVRFIADSNKFHEFGAVDGFIQNVRGYMVHKHRLVTTQPRLVGRKGPRLWVLINKEKDVYIQCLLYSVDSEPSYPKGTCYKVIHSRLEEWEKAQS